MTVFGTRPEAIKFAPVIRAIIRNPDLEVINIVTSQHTELLRPLIDLFDIDVSADLDVMRHDQPLNGVLSRIVDRLDAELVRWMPDVVHCCRNPNAWGALIVVHMFAPPLAETLLESNWFALAPDRKQFRQLTPAHLEKFETTVLSYQWLCSAESITFKEEARTQAFKPQYQAYLPFKNRCLMRISGAVEKTRTSTGVTPQRPQRCASTNSATTALPVTW